MASQGAILRLMNDSAGAVLNALEKTATFQSETLLIGEFEEFGIMLVWDETAGTGTFDVTVQISPDGGTTWMSMPATINSETAAAMTQITASGNAVKFWTNPLPNNGSSAIRFVFTAGSTPTYDITAYIVAKKVARALDI